MADIVGHVSDQEEGPEDGGEDGVADHDDFCHCLKADYEGANCQERGIDQSISK